MELVTIESKELSGIEKTSAMEIVSTFAPMQKMLENLEYVYLKTLEDAKSDKSPEMAAQAKRLRLDIRKVKSDTEKARKKRKDGALAECRAIDGIGNILKFAMQGKEEKLKAIEDYAENIERKRLEKLQDERTLALSPYVGDDDKKDLASMDDDVWEAFLSIKKQTFKELEAAKKQAEEDRIKKEKEEAERQAKIEADNKRLREEKAAKEKQDRVDADARKKQQREKDEKQREKERTARIESQRKINAANKEKEEAARELKKIQDAADKKEREEKAEIARKEAEKKAAEQAELNKGDAEKVADLKADIWALTEKYAFESESNKIMYAGFAELMNKTLIYINKNNSK